MSARKQRPVYGDDVTPGMSLRDIAACLGVSTARLSGYKRIAAIPRDEFEAMVESDNPPTRAELFAWRPDGTQPVPTRGRVERAMEIIRSMTDDERKELGRRVKSEVQS